MRTQGLLAFMIVAVAACGDRRPREEERRAEPPADAAVREPADTPPAPTPAPRTADPRASVPVEIAVQVDGREYGAKGLGECTHTADASIYDVPAAQWATRYSGGGSELEHLSLTVWQPKAGGPDQINLSVTADGKSRQIATVAGGKVIGKGIASVRRHGKGGTLAAEGEDGDGTPVRISVLCERLDAPVAEGG